MWNPPWWRWTRRSSAVEEDDVKRLLGLCEDNVKSIEGLVGGGDLLKQRQCSDLSTKLSKTTLNVKELVSQSGASADLFRSSLVNLLAGLKKAKVLVSNCAGEDWCAESVSQIQNETVFYEILMEVGLCYKAIYEAIYKQAKIEGSKICVEDLRQTLVFRPALDSDVVEDQQELDFLKPCEYIVLNIEELARGGDLLNENQCQDLSTKLSKIIRNLRELETSFGSSALLFRPALKNLYRYLEKAKLLVKKCGKKYWWKAAVFQIQNENTFREILLDVNLCYNAIYEQAENMSTYLPEDLRQSSVFLPTLHSNVVKDQQELQMRLEALANDPSRIKLLGDSLPDEVALAQCLARYLLLKMHCAYEHSHATTLDTCSEILWQKDTEPPGTWGSVRSIGSGAGGFVCSTTWLGVPCAKKVFFAKGFESSFLKEAGISALLKHPCIIDFICCGNDLESGDCFIAMEHMEKSLFELINDWKEGDNFSVPTAIDIIVQIARGMCYLHDQGVAHRDLKPQNVVVNRLTSPNVEDHFDIKLVDFGMSKTKVEYSKSITMSGFGIGTSVYRAPEVYRLAHLDGQGKAFWFKADVFSFAMTCAHLLRLEVPFCGTWPNDVYRELKKEHRPNLPYDCPKELASLLKDCWNTNPSLRPSFLEICRRLERFRHGISRGFTTLNFTLKEEKIDFILEENIMDFMKTKLEEQPLIQRPFMRNISDESKDGNIKNEASPVISCACGHALSLRVANQLYEGLVCCNICEEDVVGQVYHCEYLCQFNAHEDCAEIKDEVNVSFHDHDSLHLLVRNYYKNNLDVKCGLCREPLHDSEWVYRCEVCNFDVHAICTKFPNEKMHPKHADHRLTLIQPPPKSMLCMRCNRDIQGCCYSCPERKCAFQLHPFCAILSANQLSTVPLQSRSRCNRCGALGISWFHHCNSCAVDIYLDCVDDLEEVEDDWNAAYEKFLLEYDQMLTIDDHDHTKMNLITRLLDKLQGHNTQEASSSSSSRPPPERRAEKTATKGGRQKLKAEMLEMLTILGETVDDLQSSKRLSQADAKVLAAALEKHERRLYRTLQRMQVENNVEMRQGPRIGLFCKWTQESSSMELLTSLEADMEGVRLFLLCEEPGYQHFVHNHAEPRVFNGALGKKRLQKLQPLLASGLRYREQRSARRQHVEVEKKTEDSDAAEWFLHDLKNDGIRSLKSSGLVPVRFKGDCDPWTSRHTLAWLCTDHFTRGLKAGILEYYPVKQTYHNLAYDQQHQFLY